MAAGPVGECLRLEEGRFVELTAEPAQRSTGAVLHGAEEPQVLCRCFGSFEKGDRGLEREPGELLVKDEEGATRVSPKTAGADAVLGAAAPETSRHVGACLVGDEPVGPVPWSGARL